MNGNFNSNRNSNKKDYNSIAICGYTTADAELETRNTRDGKTFTVCNNVSVAVQNGMTTDFFRLSLTGKTAENFANYCGKGSQVLVYGRMTSNTVTDQQGHSQVFWSIRDPKIQYLNTKKSQNDANASMNPNLIPQYMQNGFIPNSFNQTGMPGYAGQGFSQQTQQDYGSYNLDTTDLPY